MVLKKDKLHLKKLKIVSISITALFIFCVIGYFVLGYMGYIYVKSGEGKNVYEFVEDMDGDGEKENVKFVNQHYSYYIKHTCDSEYTSNNIKIYLDGEKVYNDKISTLNPLLNPIIVDLVEKNTKRKQIYVHADGGGPSVPMDYFFILKIGKFWLK